MGNVRQRLIGVLCLLRMRSRGILPTAIAGLAIAISVGCVRGPWHYYETTLKLISVGDRKGKLLAMFHPGAGYTDPDAGLQIRARHQTPSGDLLEIGEIVLINQIDKKLIPYWFLFQNERLVRWGKPEDWPKTAAQHPIEFTPSINPVYKGWKIDLSTSEEEISK